MLTFAPLPAEMPSCPDCYPDHAQARQLYFLPTGLELANTAAGDPDFFLLRYHGDLATASGGFLRMSHRLVPPPFSTLESLAQVGWQLSPIPFDAGRFRLQLRSLLEAEQGQVGNWRPLSLAGGQVQATAVSLTSLETQLLQALLEDGRGVVGHEVELHYRGLVPGLPYLVTIDRVALLEHLAATLGEESVHADQVGAAVLSLPETAISWRALDPEAEHPDRETLCLEIAARALEQLFQPQPEQPEEQQSAADPFSPVSYRLQPGVIEGDPPAFLTWDLLVPRQEWRVHRVSWSISTLYAQLADPASRSRFFPVVTRVSPFAQAEIFVLNHVPFDPSYLQRVEVELSYVGASGVKVHQQVVFPGQGDVARFRVFYPAVTAALSLEYRCTAILAPPGGMGWPVVLRGETRAAIGTVIELDRQAIGLDFVRVEVESALFDRAQQLEVAIRSAAAASTSAAGATSEPPEEPVVTVETPAATVPEPLATLTLTAARPSAWIALPGVQVDAPLLATATAIGPAAFSAPRRVLHDGPVVARALRLAAWQLDALEPERITLTLAADLSARFAFVAVEIARLDGDGRYFRLEADHPREWTFFRSSVFEPVCYRYRIDCVAFDAAGATRPMESTGWIETSVLALEIRPPLSEPEFP